MMNQAPAIERLKIPAYDWWNEALHGVARSGNATVFPQAIAMAATFDEEAILKTYTIVSDEARAKYHRYQKQNRIDRYKGLTFWTPNINIFRDPRWGRGQETYGEDPFLTGRLGQNVVRGLQGNDSKYFKVHACAKHFAVHSGPEWSRHQYDAHPSKRDLWTTYLPAFETLINSNVQEVMCAYNRFEGKPCCGSDTLLRSILREKWKYKNFVTSDCYAIDDFYLPFHHSTHSNASIASSDAVHNGTDIECGNSYRALKTALEDGLIKIEELDISLKKLLKGKFELGMFDPDDRVPYAQIPFEVVESSEHSQHALDMSRKSIVLLKNENNTLPLSKDIKKVAVIGPNANFKEMQWANYNGFPSKTVTILEGIQKKLPNSDVRYVQGCTHADKDQFVLLNDKVSSEFGPGFFAQFYNNTYFLGEPTWSGLIPQLQYTTGGDTQFAPNLPLDNIAAIFNGTFESNYSGEIEFQIAGKDGYRLYIDSNLVAETWNNLDGSKAVYKFQGELKKYNIKIEYEHLVGEAYLRLDIGYRTNLSFQSAIDLAKESDIVIFVGGISPRLEGEEMPVDYDGFRGGDRTNIELPQVQKDLIQALYSVQTNIIYVVCTGSALALNWENDHLNAIVLAWYGGQNGGTAVADVLFGDYNPAGRLPITFYNTVDNLPDFEDYSMKNRTYRYFTGSPLFYFGFGLSYSTFTYSNGKLSSNEIKVNQDVNFTVDVKNTGSFDGDEVIQVYVKYPDNDNEPLKALKGFKRINIKAGETKQVNINLDSKTFLTFDEKTEEMKVVPGKYQVMYGSSSQDYFENTFNITIQ